MSAATPGRRPRVPRWPGWDRLPRDTRDTLFLLLVIGWTVLPHVGHLPIWCSCLTLTVLLWRARLALSNASLPGRWTLVGVLLAAAGLTWWSFGTVLGKEPGVTMAVVLMAMKTLELRARRDAFVVFFLGFFLILTHFLYSQSLLVAMAMLVSIWGLLTALVLAHMPVGQPSLRQAGSLAARTALLGAPIMALLFVLFPRVGPLWGVPQDGFAKSGLSNQMKLGSMAEVALDDTIAMRLRFEGEPPPPAEQYFRGPVLSRFDGVTWRQGATDFGAPNRRNEDTEILVRGRPVDYEMTIEPQEITSLPLLDATPQAPTIEGFRVFAVPGLQWRLDKPLAERVRFKAQAYLDRRIGPTEPGPWMRDELALPRGYNPRTLAWAQAMRSDARYAEAPPRVLAQALLQHIRTGGYSYTLGAETYGHDAVDEFWLDQKEGFCEHFAAAFVVVMRDLGVPARVVTGYQGMDESPVDGYYVVRQSSAHAWAEFWEPGTGWVRADPTAAVAPERIDRGRRLARSHGLVASAIDDVSPELLERMRNGWEAVNNRWNQWVLNYTRGQQLDLMKSLGVQSPSWEDLALLLIGSLSTLALAGAAWAWWDRRRIDPWVRQMERMRGALASRGVTAAAHEAPRSLARRVRERFGAQGEALADVLDELERQRYGREARTRPDGALTRRFLALARQLR